MGSFGVGGDDGDSVWGALGKLRVLVEFALMLLTSPGDNQHISQILTNVPGGGGGMGINPRSGLHQHFDSDVLCVLSPLLYGHTPFSIII